MEAAAASACRTVMVVLPSLVEEKGKKTILFFRSTRANCKRTKSKFEVRTKSPLFTQKADFFFYQGHIKWQFCEINFRAKSVESRDSSQNSRIESKW